LKEKDKDNNDDNAGGTVASTIIEVKLLQSQKAELPIVVTEFGIVTEVKLLHDEKTPFSIAVIEFGIVTEVKPLHPQKAYIPIDVTELGIVNVPVKPLQL